MNALNLPEFNILHVDENAFDYLFTAEKKDKLKSCLERGHDELYSHGVNDRMVRDVNMHGKRAGILLRHKRYKCRLCGKTFMEPIDCMEEDAKITYSSCSTVGAARL